jgi:hypothetical protein
MKDIIILVTLEEELPKDSLKEFYVEDIGEHVFKKNARVRSAFNKLKYRLKQTKY